MPHDDAGNQPPGVHAPGIAKSGSGGNPGKILNNLNAVFLLFTR